MFVTVLWWEFPDGPFPLNLEELKHFTNNHFFPTFLTRYERLSKHLPLWFMKHLHSFNFLSWLNGCNSIFTCKAHHSWSVTPSLLFFGCVSFPFIAASSNFVWTKWHMACISVNNIHTVFTIQQTFYLSNRYWVLVSVIKY